MVDFSIPLELEALRERVSAVVRDKIIPMEKDPRQDRHGPSDELRRELVEMTRARDCCRRTRRRNGAGSG